MFRPAKMKQMDVLILERDVDAVTERLGRLGLLEPKPVDSQLAQRHLDVAGMVEEWGAIESRCVALMRDMTGAEPGEAEPAQLTANDARDLIESTETQLAELRATLRELQSRRDRLAGVRNELSP